MRVLPRRDAARLVDMAREAMVTRSRDLDVFMFGDARDVRLVDWSDGLAFAVFCAKPAHRLLLESVYGMLTLKNGVPIGYVLVSALFGSSEIAYNVFETFRGSESGHVYGAVLATAHHLFGSDTFTVYLYQTCPERPRLPRALPADRLDAPKWELILHGPLTSDGSSQV